MQQAEAQQGAEADLQAEGGREEPARGAAMKARIMGHIVDLPIDKRLELSSHRPPPIIAQQAMFIPGPLPGMNDYISTGSRFIYGHDKKKWQSIITHAIKTHGLGPMPSAWFRFQWREKAKRRNPDNFAAIGKKFIFDALVHVGILENDGWGEILGWEDRWCIDADSPGVYVEMFASNLGGEHASKG
jgi:hypothetical protein